MPFDLRHYANILRLLRLLRATHLSLFKGKGHEEWRRFVGLFIDTDNFAACS